MNKTHHTRRDFLATLLAAGTVASCTPPEVASTELAQRLRGAEFIEGSDSSRTPRTINQINRLATDKYTVLAFGFGACGDLCPVLFPQLGALEAKGFQIAVIDTIPETEGDPRMQDPLASMLRKTYTKNPITLYAVDSMHRLSNQAAINASYNLGANTHSSDGTQHTGKVFLFDPSGKQIAEAQINKPGTLGDPGIIDESTIVERFAEEKIKSEAARVQAAAKR